MSNISRREFLGQREADAARANWQSYFRTHDAFLLPTAFVPAFKHDHGPWSKRALETSEGLRTYMDLSFWISFATHTGLPATVVPVGLTKEGLPVGAQIIGPYLEDATPIDLAEKMEDLLGRPLVLPVFARAQEKPLATKVEHFFIASDKAQSLFTYFKETFQLPEVWPFFDHDTFASGGLSLGNVVLEFVSFPKADHTPRKTEFQRIAFEPTADAAQTVAELARRNITHTGIKLYKFEIPGRKVLVEWSSINLSDFPPTNANIFFCDYKDRQGVARGRRAAGDELVKRGGGPLGIVEVADLDKARSWIEDHSGRKLEPYDGFYGRSILILPELTHGVWMELFQ